MVRGLTCEFAGKSEDFYFESVLALLAGYEAFAGECLPRENSDV